VSTSASQSIINTAVWQHGDAAALDDLLTSDYVDHDPLPGFGTGRAAALRGTGRAR
jgi:hypothetical protein